MSIPRSPSNTGMLVALAAATLAILAAAWLLANVAIGVHALISLLGDLLWP